MLEIFKKKKKWQDISVDNLKKIANNYAHGGIINKHFTLKTRHFRTRKLYSGLNL